MSIRQQFIDEMTANLLLPYEATHVYEEELVGEFENEFETAYFEQFVASTAKDGLVLDLACGDGRHTLPLSRHGKRVVGLDLSPNGLSMARRKCAAQEGIVFLRASMLELPLVGNAFDGVWLSQAFEYVPPDRRERFLAGIKRVLKPGGMLYMSVETWMYPDVWTSLKELWGDLRLFCYWKFLKGKPLLWGEFLYYLPPGNAWSWAVGWHYHAHTDKWTLLKLLRRGFEVLRLDLYNGYIYALCRKKVTSV